MAQFVLEKTSQYQYVTMLHDDSAHEDIRSRCSVSTLQKALDDNRVTNSRVVWANIRNGQSLDKNHPLLKNLFEMGLHQEIMEGLPDFCDILMEQDLPGGHTAAVSVWAPLNWNERFLGCGGGGLQTVVDVRMFEAVRTSSVVSGALNGFAAACTDGGLTDPRMMSWGLNDETGELDTEMIRNWSHRALHEMTVAAKIIVGALYGKKPLYSYYQGSSTGGRMGLSEAMRYPEDYDGIWCDAPATNYTRFQMSGGWPLYVMNWHNDIVSEAKLEAFTRASLEQFGCEDGYIDSTDAVPFDPFTLVGHETKDGPITETDAQVLKEILDGPHSENGEKLFYGIFPGTMLVDPSGMGLGLIAFADSKNGKREPVNFVIPDTYVGSWVIQDASWDWRTMTREQYSKLFRYSQKKFMKMISGEESDLSAYRDRGGKLLLSHCANDSLVFPGGTIELYHRITEKMGGEDKTLPFARFFLTPGGSHCFHTALGIPLADGMIKLMEWVEKGIAPEKVSLEIYDIRTLPAKCLMRKEGVLYKPSEHPDFEYAVPPLRDVPYEENEAEDKELIENLRETSRKNATGLVEEMKGKYMSMSSMFGTGK